MRMWMVNPRIMCDQHLRGEYVECLMIAGTLKKKKSMTGYFKSNCVEVVSLVSRFLYLKMEMLNRGFNAVKNLDSVDYSYLPKEEQKYKIDRTKSIRMLLSRCKSCRSRYNKGMKAYMEEN